MPKRNIAILLSTFNGERYIKAQLDSILRQTYQDYEVIIRDDGSTDKTLDIINEFDDNFTILDHENNVGARRSFSILLEYALQKTEARYFMFCDQDDVWEYTKIEKTLQKIERLADIYGNGKPLLVHTDLKVVNKSLKIIASSFWQHEALSPEYNSFNRLLLQNTVTGCTAMINKKLAQISIPFPDKIIMHDWWIALVASQFGYIAYIDKPLVQYRQHEHNNIGAQSFSLLEKISDLSILQKSMQNNYLQAEAFLSMFYNILDNNTKQMLHEFVTLNSKTKLQKWKVLIRYKIWKQGILRNIGLLILI